VFQITSRRIFKDLFTGAISLSLGGVAKIKIISTKSYQFFKMKHFIFDSIIE